MFFIYYGYGVFLFSFEPQDFTILKIGQDVVVIDDTLQIDVVLVSWN